MVEEWNCSEGEKLWYLSGLFEADGCVKVNRVVNIRKGVEHVNHCIEMQLISEVVELANAFKMLGGKVYKTKRGHFEWRATGEDALHAAKVLARGTTEKAQQMNEIIKFPMGKQGNTPALREFKRQSTPLREKIRRDITRMKQEGSGVPFDFPECGVNERETFIAGFIDGDGWTGNHIVGVLQKRGAIVKWIHSLYGGNIKEVFKSCKGKQYGPYTNLVVPKHDMASVIARTRLSTKK